MKKLGVSGRCRVFEIPKVGICYGSTPDVFSIDEVFMDVTDYLSMYQMTAKELSVRIMQDVLDSTGITATCGIGTNLYLAKIALDIQAKHVEDHIGILDEERYRKLLWNHRPLTYFWRIGPGIARQLERVGIHTMGEIAHAWGRETTTIPDIKNYKPKTNSISRGQVLPCDYNFQEGGLVVKEMADLLSLDLVKEGLVTDSITLHVGYSNRIPKKSAYGTIGMTVTTSYRKLRQVKKNDIITAIYYHNGKCLKVEGMVSRIDDTSRILKIVNTRIPFDDLYDISGESNTCNK